MGALLFFKIYRGDFLATLISIISMVIRWIGIIMCVGGDVLLALSCSLWGSVCTSTPKPGKRNKKPAAAEIRLPLLHFTQ